MTQRDKLLALLEEFGVKREDTTGWYPSLGGGETFKHHVVIDDKMDDATAVFAFTPEGQFIGCGVGETAWSALTQAVGDDA